METRVEDPTLTARPSVAPAMPRMWRDGLVAAAIAAASNLLVWVTARSAGVDLVVRVQEGAPPTAVAAAQVLATTVLAFVVGLALLQVTARRRAPATRMAQVVGGVVAVASTAMPLGVAEAGTGTRAALVAMHLVAGAVFVVALGRARRP